MNSRRNWVAAALLVATAVGVWLWLSDDERAPNGLLPGGPAGAVAAASEGRDLDRASAGPTAAAPKPGALTAEGWPSSVVQPGAPQRRVAGVVQHDGAPVADATVTLSATMYLPGFEVTTRSGGDGRFDFGLRPPVSGLVCASKEGLAPGCDAVDLRDPTGRPKAEDVTLNLTGCEAKVVGRVYDSGGGTVPNAQVRVRGSVATRVSAEGEYELCVEPGEVQLEASADGYGAIRMALRASGRTVRDIRLVAAATLAGKVINADTQQPMPGVLVSAFPAAWNRYETPRTGVAISGSDGRFHLSVAPGEFQLRAMSDSGRSVSQPVSATVNRPIDDLVLRVKLRPVLRGTVRRDGKPVAGAEVMAASGTDDWSDGAVSQKDGSFVVRSVMPGPVKLSAKPFSVLAPKTFAMPTTDATVVIDVRPFGSVHGVVRSAAGEPVLGAEVNFQAPAWKSANTDANGQYVLLGLPSGTYTVFASSARAGGFVEHKNFVIGDGEDKELNLTLDLAATISGKVIDQEGKGVPSVSVLWQHVVTRDEGRCITDAEGAYRCDQMSGGGEYRAKVYPTDATGHPLAPIGTHPPVKLENGSAKVEGVVLKVKNEVFTISGKVVDTAGGPLPDVKVRAMMAAEGERPRFNQWLSLPTTIADANGQFELSNLAAGAWALEARTADGADAVVNGIKSGAKNVVITVKSGGVIEGTLVGYQHKPTIYARELGGSKLSWIPVDGETFKYGTPAGTYVVTAQNDDEGDSQKVEVKSGETAKVTLTSKGKGKIEGTVVDFVSRQPIAGVLCHSVVMAGDEMGVTNWGDEHTPQSDAKGVFVIDPSPAGRVGVNCMGDQSQYSSGSATATVERGGVAKVEVEIVKRDLQHGGGEHGITFDMMSQLARVGSLQPGSAAVKAGLLPGDVLTSIDGRSVTSLEPFGVQVLLDNHPPGTAVPIVVSRGGQSKSLTLTLTGLE